MYTIKYTCILHGIDVQSDTIRKFNGQRKFEGPRSSSMRPLNAFDFSTRNFLCAIQRDGRWQFTNRLSTWTLVSHVLVLFMDSIP